MGTEKELPFFKFKVAKWLTGDIVFEDFSIQGFFINVCAIYWERKCKLSVDEVNKRYKNPELLEAITGRFISVLDGAISIKFLDEQKDELKVLSGVNSKNGKLGGRPPIKDKKPNGKRTKTEPKPDESHKEKEKEEDIKRRQSDFRDSIRPFKETYGDKMCHAFFNYWSEANFKKGKLKYEMQDTWELSKRLSTWAGKQDDFKKPVAQGNSMQGIV